MKVTKDEIIGIVLKKLEPNKEETVADIGFGSGKVSLEFSKYFKFVYAVDIDENAIKNFKPESRNIAVIKSHGMDFLRENSVDKAFFGGTKDIEKMLEIALENKSIRSIVIVNAARIGVATRVINKMKELGIFREALIVNISKSYELAGDIAFKNLNPVFIVVGDFRFLINS